MTVQWLLDLKADPAATEKAARVALDAYARAHEARDDERMVAAVEASQADIEWPEQWDNETDLTKLL